MVNLLKAKNKKLIVFLGSLLLGFMLMISGYESDIVNASSNEACDESFTNLSQEEQPQGQYGYGYSDRIAQKALVPLPLEKQAVEEPRIEQPKIEEPRIEEPLEPSITEPAENQVIEPQPNSKPQPTSEPVRPIESNEGSENSFNEDQPKIEPEESVLSTVTQCADQYIALDPTKADEIAQQINYDTYGNTEVAEEVCMALAGSIAHCAGFLTDFNPGCFNGANAGIYSVAHCFNDQYTKTGNTGNTLAADSILSQSQEGDIFAIWGPGSSTWWYQHFITLTEIKGTKAYGVHNHFTRNGAVIEKQLLFDKADPTVGVFKTEDFFTKAKAFFAYVPKQRIAGVTDVNEVFSDDVTNRVLADDGLSSQEDAQSLQLSESGNYAFFKDNEKVTEQNIIVKDEQIEVKFYYDENGNESRDPDEEFLEDYKTISFKKESSAFFYTLNSGWNLINLPFANNDEDSSIQKASQLLNYWNDQGAQIRHIARFNNGKFDMFGVAGECSEVSKDFWLVPGQGIFVYNTGFKIDVTINGNEFDESVPLNFARGWNLVGIYSIDEEYNSETLLKAISDNGIEADTISQFENGLYDSVIWQSDVVYGNNFNIIPQRGYFIRVNQVAEKEFLP